MVRRGKGKGKKGDQGRGGPYSHKVTYALGTARLLGCALGTRAPQMWAHILVSTQHEAHSRVCGQQVGKSPHWGGVRPGFHVQCSLS